MNTCNQAEAGRCKTCGAVLASNRGGERCPSCALEHAVQAQDTYSPMRTVPYDGSSTRSDSISGLPCRFGDYELLEEIARGGMGVVFKARQVSLDRMVAIKMLLFGPLASAEDVQRFRTEAAAAASLQHPNIVAIHEVGFRDGQHFLAMDYVVGRSLAEIAQEGPLSLRRAAGYVKTIAEAIHYAHARGILHRDLKPSNILVDSVDQPRVTDFGLAKRLDKDSELTLSGQIMGSPGYMAPEQAAAHRGLVGKRSDVYSLGGILYHLLTGRAPFVAPTVAETLRQVQNAEPVSPTVLNPHLARDLKTICLKCLEKEPARRYQTAQELAEDLTRFLDDKPILARPVSRREKVWRWCRRKPVIATLSASTLLLLLAVVIGSPIALFHINKHRQDAEQNARDLRESLYAAQMNQAYRAWDVGNLDVARAALLNTRRPQPGAQDLRGTDWRWLWSLCQSEATDEIPAQPGGMVFAVPSPDGQRVATAGWSSDIRIYDLAGGGELQKLAGHTRKVAGFSPLAWSPDGRRLLSASGGPLEPRGRCEFFLWDLESGSYRPLVGHSNWLHAVAFSPDGRWIASGSQDGEVGLWDACSGTNAAMLRGHEGPVYAVMFSPDSQWLFSGGKDGTVRWWDLLTRREVGPPFEHELGVIHMAVSAHGGATTIATACMDQYVRLWELPSRTGRKLRYSMVECPVAPTFSPDGRFLAFGSGNNIRIWDLLTEQERTVLRGSRSQIINLRFLPNGKQLISSSQFHAPLIWDIDRPEKLVTLRASSEVFCMTLSADQRRLVLGTGDYYYEPDRPGEVLVFDLASQKQLLPPLIHPQVVNSISLTADGKLLATGCADHHVRVFTLPEGKLLRTLANAVENYPGAIVFSPDGRVLVTSCAHEIAVWDTTTWTASPLLRKPQVSVQGLAFSPDGSWLVTPMGEANCAIVWHMPSGATNAVLPMEHLTSGAAFSADGRLLAVKADWNIALFEVNGWKPVGVLKGHESFVSAMAFAPDGKTLASVGFDGSLRLWRLPARAEVAVLHDHVDSTATVAFTSDGRWLISGSRDKTVKLRKIPTFAEIRAAERSLPSPED